MNPSDLLIIKAHLDDDIRKIPMHNNEITYDELILMMERVYNGKISPDEDIIIKYKDEDGDYITTMNDTDLSCANHTKGVLEIKLFRSNSCSLNRQNENGNLNLSEELQNIRTQLADLHLLVDSISKSMNKQPDAVGSHPSDKVESSQDFGRHPCSAAVGAPGDAANGRQASQSPHFSSPALTSSSDSHRQADAGGPHVNKTGVQHAVPAPFVPKPGEQAPVAHHSLFPSAQVPQPVKPGPPAASLPGGPHPAEFGVPGPQLPSVTSSGGFYFGPAMQPAATAPQPPIGSQPMFAGPQLGPYPGRPTSANLGGPPAGAAINMTPPPPSLQLGGPPQPSAPGGLHHQQQQAFYRPPHGQPPSTTGAGLPMPPTLASGPGIGAHPTSFAPPGPMPPPTYQQQPPPAAQGPPGPPHPGMRPPPPNPASYAQPGPYGPAMFMPYSGGAK